MGQIHRHTSSVGSGFHIRHQWPEERLVFRSRGQVFPSILFPAFHTITNIIAQMLCRRGPEKYLPTTWKVGFNVGSVVGGTYKLILALASATRSDLQVSKTPCLIQAKSRNFQPLLLTRASLGSSLSHFTPKTWFFSLSFSGSCESDGFRSLGPSGSEPWNRQHGLQAWDSRAVPAFHRQHSLIIVAERRQLHVPFPG